MGRLQNFFPFDWLLVPSDDRFFCYAETLMFIYLFICRKGGREEGRKGGKGEREGGGKVGGEWGREGGREGEKGRKKIRQ